MEKHYYMHRIKGGDSIVEPYSSPLFFKENLITIGWSDFSSTEFVNDVQANGEPALNKRFLDSNYNLSRNRWCLWRFIRKMKSGDIVIVPTYDTINICEIADDIVYSNETIAVDKIITDGGNLSFLENGYLYSNEGKLIDIGFYRKVKPIHYGIPRRHVSANLYRRLKIMQTNSDLEEFSSEIEELISSISADKEAKRKLALTNSPVDFSNVADSFKEENVTALISKPSEIINLPFNSFKIPEYQRSYRWKPTNVNQLINDVITFTDKSDYRLGTIVLHNSDVVDGQQRLVTLALIIADLQRNHNIAENAEYKSLFSAVNSFLYRTKYEDKEAQSNVLRNIAVIRLRHSDMDEHFAEALLRKCYFSVVRLPSIPEAFQFFDSQNSRGKDLEPHDLLKAFHLREVGTEDDIKKQNVEHLIDLWQDIDTDILVKLFRTLYRIRQWSRGNSARTFEKSDTWAFKGITPKNGTAIYPSYKPSYYLNLLLSTHQIITEDGSGIQNYPFQLDGVILNGKRFFDMILYYKKLFADIQNPESEVYSSCQKRNGYSSSDIIKLLSDYDKMYRVGDTYIRDLFDCLLLYYVDKFGSSDIDRAVHKIFTYSYGIRLSSFRVSVATIDDAAIGDNIFKSIRDAATPADFFNDVILPIEQYEKNCSNDIAYAYKKINLIG